MMGTITQLNKRYVFFRRRKHTSNPLRCGPIYQGSPCGIFWCVVRGMSKHNQLCSKLLTRRLTCYTSMPYEYTQARLLSIPGAHCMGRINRFPSTRLGNLFVLGGWGLRANNTLLTSYLSKLGRIINNVHFLTILRHHTLVSLFSLQTNNASLRT